MTPSSLDTVTLGKQLNASDVSDTAIALLDEQGTVAAWTHTAERLLGHPAGDIVGRSAALVLPSLDEATPTSAFVERCRAENGWPGATEVRRRDGRVLDVSVRITALHGQDGSARWLASVTDAGMPSGDAVDGSVRGPLLARAPIGVAVRDRHLRCTFANEVMDIHDGLSRDRRLGRRFTDVLPGADAETIEAVMRQVLHNGTTKIHEYRTWLPTSQGAEKPFAVSFQCLQGADGESLGVCVISADVTASWQARERLAVLDRASARLGSTLDVMQAGQELADLAVPLLADYVAVDLEQSISFGEGPRSASAPSASRVCAAPESPRSTMVSLNHRGYAVSWCPYCRTLPHFRAAVREVLPGAGAGHRCGHMDRQRAGAGAPGSRERHALDHDRAHPRTTRPAGRRPVRPHHRSRAVPRGRSAPGRRTRRPRRPVTGQRPPVRKPARRRPHPATQPPAPPFDGRHGGRGGVTLPARGRGPRRRRRLVRRDPAVRRTGGTRRRRRGRARPPRRRDHGPAPDRRPHPRRHGTAPRRTARPTRRHRPAPGRGGLRSPGPAHRGGRRHLPLRRLRPRHPPLHHGIRRTPPTRDHRPTRARLLPGPPHRDPAGCRTGGPS